MRNPTLRIKSQLPVTIIKSSIKQNEVTKVKYILHGKVSLDKVRPAEEG